MIASIWGREAGGAPGYNLAKAAVIALAKALARDHARHGIRVNSIAPGSILFPGGGWDRRRTADPDGIAAFVEREIPFGRFGTPEEVAEVVAFIASARARWITAGGELTPSHVVLSRRVGPATPSAAPAAPGAAPAAHDLEPKARDERARIVEALDACSGNQTRAAKRLGISRATLVARLTLYRIPRPRGR
jgi:hypothetical protein